VGALAAAGVFSGGSETTTITRAAKKPGSTAKKAKASALPPGTTPCGGGVSVGPATTCPFALNVQEAYEESGRSESISAFSPVTEESYAMSCTGNGTVVCRGGNEATVYLSSAGTPAAAPAPEAVSSSTESGLQQCDPNISANQVTSCPFAENVFIAYWEDWESYGEQSETYVSAYSSATGESIGMSCNLDGETVNCSGGSGAFVTFPMWAIRVY
jgi:hypothetical protein